MTKEQPTKTIAQLYLEKHEQLSEKEKEILLKAVEWEATPLMVGNDSLGEIQNVNGIINLMEEND